MKLPTLFVGVSHVRQTDNRHERDWFLQKQCKLFNRSASWRRPGQLVLNLDDDAANQSWGATHKSKDPSEASLGSFTHVYRTGAGERGGLKALGIC